MATIEKLKEIGEGIGLKGTELKAFIMEQQVLARDEQEKGRERQRMKDVDEKAEKEWEREFERQKIEMEDRERELGLKDRK